jgi:GNAT superfamily N-acetyltransferase
MAKAAQIGGTVELCGYRPGALGRVTELHGSYYAEHWGFDIRFEAEVAREMAAFLLRFDPARDGFWLAVAGNRILGSITIDGGASPAEEARLRWFVLAPESQGRGIGKRLMAQAMAFCRDRGLRRVYLHTFAGLEAARHLYERHGFRLIAEQADDDWGSRITHQTFERLL